MGVHDYCCSVCGEPEEVECREAEGGPCEVVGYGEDRAFLVFFEFPADGCPQDPEEMLGRLEEARGREVREVGYDWSEWEFVPALNYRGLLMNEGDPRGVWRVDPPETELERSEGSPVEVPLPPGRALWVINYCPACYARFVRGESASPPCELTLARIQEHLGLRADPADKQAFCRAVQAERRL